MKRSIFPALTLILIMVLSACGASTQGPTTWLDRPLDGDKAPLASLTIQAHASDADGVFKIEFYISNNLIAQIPTGRQRLGEASIEWMPPAAGSYTISARAIDTLGNIGPYTSALIVIEGATQSTVTPTPGRGTMTPTATPTSIVAMGPSLTATINTNCRAGPGKVYDVVDILPQGRTAVIEGRNAESSWFRINLSNTIRCWVSIISVSVQGDVSIVSIIAAPEIPALPPVSDTTSPEIAGLSISPDLIVSQGPGCDSSPHTASVRTMVTDDVGVTSVVARWSIGAESGEVTMTHTSGDYYEAVVGPVSETGTLSVVVVARDQAGNSRESWTVTTNVMACPG
jgi:hypothetical protein